MAFLALTVVSGRLMDQTPIDWGRLLTVLAVTAGQSAASALICLALALPGALVLGRYRFRGRGWLLKFLIIPFMLPAVTVAALFKALAGLGPAGWLPAPQLWRGLFSEGWPAVILAHVYYNYPLALLALTLARERLDPSLVEAAQVLGAGPRQIFRRLTWPALRPAASGIGLMIFSLCFLSFGVPLILGGPRISTIEVEIYREALYYFNLKQAGALVAAEMMFGWLLFWFWARDAYFIEPSGAKPNLARPDALKARLALGVQLGLLLVFLGAPLAILIRATLTTRRGWGLEHWRALFKSGSGLFEPSPWAALTLSGGAAVLTMFMAVFLALSSAIWLSRLEKRRARRIEAFLMLPWATSAISLGLALSLFWVRFAANFRDSLPALALSHTLVAWPLAFRMLWPHFRACPLQLHQAAAVLGASPWQVWLRIRWPLLRDPLLASAALAAAASLGEFGASSFMVRGERQTLTTAIHYYLSQPGDLNQGRAMIMALLLILATLAAGALAERLGRPPGRTAAARNHEP